MKYLLDTSVCVTDLRGKNPLVLTRVQSCQSADVVVCSIVVGELVTGALRSASPVTEQAKVDAFLLPYQSLPIDDTVALRYAEIRADLETRGFIIGDMDILIAAVALIHGLIVVTHNRKDFSRIPNLSIEDWAIP